jgi:hypothetical protein
MIIEHINIRKGNDVVIEEVLFLLEVVVAEIVFYMKIHKRYVMKFVYQIYY